MLLSLPSEIKLDIARLLVAFLDLKNPPAQTLAKRHSKDSFKDVSNLAMTCREWKAICSEVLVQGVCLIGEESHKRFLCDLDSGSLSAAVRTKKKVKFLSFGSPAYCDDCGSSRLGYVHGHDETTKRIIEHFSSSITTLELVNYPFKFDDFRTIIAFKGLRTLYVLDPGPRAYPVTTFESSISSWSIPPLETLSIVVKDLREVQHASNIMHFFGKSLVSFSMKSEKKHERDVPAHWDFLGPGAVYIANPDYAERFRNLRHLHIGHLPTTIWSLRDTIENLADLESLVVDCHGVKPDGALSLFYALDMLSMAVDPYAGRKDLISWEYIPRGCDKKMELRNDGWMRNPHVDDAKVWWRPLAIFAFVLGPADWAKGLRRTVEELQLVFASCDAKGAPVNADMRFTELVEVFQSKAAVLCTLKSLSIGMADDRHFDCKETQLELENAVFSLSHHLASLESIDINWGRVRTVYEPSKTAAKLFEK